LMLFLYLSEDSGKVGEFAVNVVVCFRGIKGLLREAFP
jgi:hypothetical protein